MTQPQTRQTIVDDEHLKLLSWGYLFSGVMTALFSLLGLLYALMGLFMSTMLSAAAKAGERTDAMTPESIGAFLGIFGLIFFLFSISVAIAKFVAASCIKRRKSRTLCLIVAGLTCFGIPYGTVLGVCSFMVLGRESVVLQFANRTAPIQA